MNPFALKTSCILIFDVLVEEKIFFVGEMLINYSISDVAYPFRLSVGLIIISEMKLQSKK